MRVEFYAIEKPRFCGKPLELVCVLAQKAFESDTPTLILVEAMADAEALDELLWSWADDAYIPHQVAGDDDDADCPILIVPAEIDTPARPLMVNLRARAAPDGAARVIELIPDDETEKNAARARWTAYKRRGHEPVKVVV